ncbi:LOW QUALITY PROTEIN: DNA-directed RNA polymerase III subunit RPC7 [Cyanocitta cristata]
MAESGSGGGCASFTFSIEAICCGKDAALPDVICKPPPPFPQLRDTVKRTRTMKKSRKHGHQQVQKQKRQKSDPKSNLVVIKNLNSTLWQYGGHAVSVTWDYLVKRLPCQELEKKDEEEEKSKDEKDETKDKEGEDDEAEEPEEYDEEEYEEENDYISSYFEDGDDFGAVSDDNMDEATY